MVNSMYSGNVFLSQFMHLRPTALSVHNKAVYSTVIQRQLELAKASRLADTSRFASASLPWVQWLSGKHVQLVVPGFDSKLESCAFFFSLSPKITS